MVKLTDETFLQEYLAVVYGENFAGVLPLWNKQTKATRTFSSASIPALIAAVKADASRNDLYLGLATQSEELGAGKRGGNSTVVQVSALFADIDFATDKTSGKKYVVDEETALRILAEFPYSPTLVQRSGGGLHVIWMLDVPLICRTDADRKRAAKLAKAFHRKLARLFKKYGYDIDDCSDLARVYRVPMSFNHNYGEPRRVEMLIWNPEIRIDIAALLVATTPAASASRSDKPQERDADHELICQNCPWYRHMTSDGAATASEPEWLAALSNTAQCAGGREIAHQYSAQHPQYRQRETDQKSDHVVRDLKPFTCEVIAETYGGAEFCDTCEWRGKIKSPVQLGNERLLVLLQQRLVAPEGGWPDQYKDGRPRPSFRNAILCLLRLDVEIRYDLFRMRISVNGVAVQEFSGDMNDDALAYLRKQATDKFCFDPGKTNIGDAAHTIALENAFHPIRDYLDNLVWDGNERLARLLIDYFGAEDTEINRVFALATLIAAVRRARSPGAKFDTMLVLEGPQGSGKSSAILTLAGEGNFSEQSIIGLDQKVQGELLQGVWLYEVAELSGLKHTDSNDLKSFLSRDTDRFRAAYARFTTSNPRQVIFIGTTNDATYLKDETGNRRFWPVRTSMIDQDALERDRDQIWAEAAHLEAQGFPITLPKKLWDDAKVLQASRMPQDPWLDALTNVEGFEQVDGEVRVSTQVLFGPSNLNISAGNRKDYHTKRLSRVMNDLGWKGPKTLRINGRAQRGYFRPADTFDGQTVEF